MTQQLKENITNEIKPFFSRFFFFFNGLREKNKQTHKQTSEKTIQDEKKILNPSLQPAVLFKAMVIISSDYDYFSEDNIVKKS